MGGKTGGFRCPYCRLPMGAARDVRSEEHMLRLFDLKEAQCSYGHDGCTYKVRANGIQVGFNL